MRRVLLALMLAGCVSEHALELEIRAAVSVPPEVVSWELRLARLEGDESCPSADEAAGAVPIGRLATAQTFATEGMAVGEVPPGRWAFATLARDVDCGVLLYGCREVVIGPDAVSPIVIDVDAVAITEACGCRACDVGACAPVAAECP